MNSVLALFRNVVFMGWLCLFLMSSALAIGAFAVQSAVSVGALTAKVAEQTKIIAAKNKTIASMSKSITSLKNRAALQLSAFEKKIKKLTAENAEKIATLTAAHRDKLAKAVLKTKAKARLRQFVVAIPLVGLAAVAAFEELDFREWLRDHPAGTRAEYGCQTYAASVEVLEEFSAEAEPVLEKVPELVRPSPETVLGWLPECSDEPSSP